MKILGIGNAIIDVICKVSDEFLAFNSLTKSTMKLVNEDEFRNLLSLNLLFSKFAFNVCVQCLSISTNPRELNPLFLNPYDKPPHPANRSITFIILTLKI